MPRQGLYIIASLLILGAISATADALMVTEREELEQFVSDITGEVSQTRIDHALRYSDPAALSLEVVHAGKVDIYDDRNRDQLSAGARQALSPLAGGKLRLIQKSIQIDDGAARVAVRVLTEHGFANAVFQLRRLDGKWLTRRIVVS